MSRTLRLPNRSTGRCRPRLERLESRLALSAAVNVSPFETVAASGQFSAFDTTSPSSTGPIATLTSPVADVASSPTVVTVKFNAPIDPLSVLYLDVLIEEQVNGSWVNACSNAPSESLDPSGTQLSLTLNQPLSPGHYRVVLPTTTFLWWASGGSIVDFNQDQVLGGFTVEQPGITLGDASSLSSPASGPVSASGALDLQDDPGAVDLYTFTLPDGHHWRLGAEVLAHQIGSALLSDLTLFDAQGQVIATANTGLAGNPTDPYLFQGLNPGTYYIGVSAAGNVPGTANGYNPVSGLRANNLSPQTGGAYQLNLQAEVADKPTQVLGVSLQYADPLDPHPTGFAIAFSGPLSTGTLAGGSSAGIELVNQNGQLFPITAVAQREASAQYLFLADEDLPAGHYSIVVPDAANGGVTDLAGFTPIAAGEPAGVLATFNVTGGLDPNPYDLGPLYANGSNNVGSSAVVAPGATVTYRFVATLAGVYKFQGQASGGLLIIEATAPGGATTMYNAGQGGQASVTKSLLEPGVYYLQFQNVGHTPTVLNWSLHDLVTSQVLEALLNNGVGQGPALNAMTIVGSAAGLSGLGATDSSWAGQPTAGATGGSVATTGSTTVASASGAIVAPAGLWLTFGNALVGRPSLQTDHVSTVGPSSGTGSTAMASSASGLLQAMVTARTLPKLAPVNEFVDAVPASGLLETDQEPPVNGALVASTKVQESRADDRVIASADWISRVGATASRWLAMAPLDASELAAEAPQAEAAPIALARDDSGSSSASMTTEEGVVERADFGMPVAVSVATVMSFRYHPPFLRWVKRNRNTTGSSRASILRGSRSRFWASSRKIHVNF